MPSQLSGFRRRILIEPAPGRVVAELEDDYHRMVVALEHLGGVVTRVECDMKRWPWTSCPGAVAKMEATFTGVALADFVARGDKTANCTHLYDLGLFASAHADEEEAVAYDLIVTDPASGRRHARLSRNGVPTLDWWLEGDNFLGPEALAGTTMKDLGKWIAAQDKAIAEAGRILRWATILALGRAMEIPAGLSARVFPAGACYTFQPEVARDATRRAGANRDFSTAGAEPMADRADAF